MFKKILFCAVVPLFAVACGPSTSQDVVNSVQSEISETLNSDVRAEIEAVVYDYFDGQGQGSEERLKRAFNVNSIMFAPAKNDDGESYLRTWPNMHTVVEGWAKNPNPDAVQRDHEILSIDVVDDRLAVVLFRSTDRFYDALTIVKIDDNWQIAAKVFVRQ